MGTKFKMKKMVAFVAVAVAAVTLAVPNAQAAVPAGSSQTVSVQGAMAPASLRALQPYVHATSTGFVLTAPATVLAKVNPAELAQLRAYHSQVRNLVAQGQTVLVADHFAGVQRDTLVGPHGFINLQWYGLEVGIDAFLVAKISGGMTIAAIGAAIGGGPAGEAVAIALGLGVGIIQICTQADGWSHIFWVGLWPPMGTAVCNPFA